MYFCTLYIIIKSTDSAESLDSLSLSLSLSLSISLSLKSSVSILHCINRLSRLYPVFTQFFLSFFLSFFLFNYLFFKITVQWSSQKEALQLLFCKVMLAGFVVSGTFSSSFFFKSFLVVQPYNRTHTATAKKTSPSILSEISNFPIVDNLSVIVHGFITRMLISFSVDEILQPKYVKLSTNFSGLPFIV